MGNNCCSEKTTNQKPIAVYIAGPSFEDVGNSDLRGNSNNTCNLQEPESRASSSAIIVRALYPYESLEEDDLSFKKGDFMEIEDPLPDGVEWVNAVNLKTKERGCIPSNYVIVHDTTPQTQDWWFDYDKKEAIKRLLQPGNVEGTFLVRYASDKTSYALSVRAIDGTTGDPCVKQYRIYRKEDDTAFFISSERTFPTLFDVINHYKENIGGLCCKLTTACSSIAPVVPFKELEISREKVRLSTKLGAGCFGEVWKGVYLKAVEVAVKTLKSGTMSAEAFLNEAKIMHHLRHRKLVQILGVVSWEEPFYIITELMAHGALRDLLHSENGRKLKFDTLIDMNSQIAEGMAYLESVNFIHRDLRAANILVGEQYDVKVADFGLARILENDEVYAANPESKFPIKWTAPEAAMERKFSVKSDVWSFGVLMYEIITFGRVPYPGMQPHKVILMVEGGYRMEKPKSKKFEVPDSFYNMMLKCWNKQPEERPTFEFLHDFFSNYFINTEPFYKPLNE